MRYIFIILFISVFICVFEESSFAKPNIKAANVRISEWTGVAGRNPAPYEEITHFSDQTLCMTIKSRENKTYNFFITGNWSSYSDGIPGESLLNVKSKSVRLKPKQHGELCIDFPAKLLGNIQFDGMVDYE